MQVMEDTVNTQWRPRRHAKANANAQASIPLGALEESCFISIFYNKLLSIEAAL